YWRAQHAQGASELGQMALDSVYRAELGLEPPTRLTARVLELFEAQTVEQVLHQMTARVRRARPDLGYLARGLLDEAGLGDATALRIVRAHGTALGEYALL